MLWLETIDLALLASAREVTAHMHTYLETERLILRPSG